MSRPNPTQMPERRTTKRPQLSKKRGPRRRRVSGASRLLPHSRFEPTRKIMAGSNVSVARETQATTSMPPTAIEVKNSSGMKRSVRKPLITSTAEARTVLPAVWRARWSASCVVRWLARSRR